MTNPNSMTAGNGTLNLWAERSTGHKTCFVSGGMTYKLVALGFYSSLVVVDSFVLRKPPERQAL